MPSPVHTATSAVVTEANGGAALDDQVSVAGSYAASCAGSGVPSGAAPPSTSIASPDQKAHSSIRGLNSPAAIRRHELVAGSYAAPSAWTVSSVVSSLPPHAIASLPVHTVTAFHRWPSGFGAIGCQATSASPPPVGEVVVVAGAVVATVVARLAGAVLTGAVGSVRGSDHSGHADDQGQR